MTCQWEIVAPARICGATAEWRDKHGKLFCSSHGEHLIKRSCGLTRVHEPGVNRHTFIYANQDDLVAQMDDLVVRMKGMEAYDTVRARYPHIKTASAFCMRLKRFTGLYPKQMGPGGRRIVKLGVTRELHAYLS